MAKLVADLLRPVHLRYAIARAVIGLHVVVVGLQIGIRGSLKTVFRQNHIQRQAFAFHWLLVGVTQAQPHNRHHALRAAQQRAHLRQIVADAADKHAAQPDAFGGEQHVLREDAYVHRANQQDFGPV